MCDHDENKRNEFLDVFDYFRYEIYICECGALINIQDKKNFDFPMHAMTKDEITQMMIDIMHPIMQSMADAKLELNLKYDEMKKLYGGT